MSITSMKSNERLALLNAAVIKFAQDLNREGLDVLATTGRELNSPAYQTALKTLAKTLGL
jgi:hypothetical protein